MRHLLILIQEAMEKRQIVSAKQTEMKKATAKLKTLGSDLNAIKKKMTKTKNENQECKSKNLSQIYQ